MIPEKAQGKVNEATVIATGPGVRDKVTRDEIFPFNTSLVVTNALVCKSGVIGILVVLLFRMERKGLANVGHSPFTHCNYDTSDPSSPCKGYCHQTM